MSFADPAILIALVAVPLLVWWYTGLQRRRAERAAAFAAPALTPSVAPHRPGWRRHAPMTAFLIALAVLIVAAARPQKSVAVPITDGAVMLADDISSSMRATDVSPSRLGAAKRAATRFIDHTPKAIQVGYMEFARHPVVLQSPTSDHALARAAVNQPVQTSGGTAVGVALTTAIHELRSVPLVAGKRPPGAIVLISDGASNVGISPLTVARQAKQDHIPVYTVAVGTPNGTIPITRGSRTTATPVPVSSEQLAEIARLSGGRAFTARTAASLSGVYDHLAAQLGHKHVKREVTASFAGGGLALLLVGGALSLGWFGRLV